MSVLRAIEIKPNQDVIDLLEDALEMARRGELLDLIIVGSIKDADGPAFFRSTEFNDRWRLLGALEYAKDGVHNG